MVAPQDITVGKVTVVADPFGNRLTLVDLSKGTYLTDQADDVTGLAGPNLQRPWSPTGNPERPTDLESLDGFPRLGHAVGEWTFRHRSAGDHPAGRLAGDLDDHVEVAVTVKSRF